MKKLALYIHWPFCVSKCPYCDFNSRPLPNETDEEVWAQAYATEIGYYATRWSGRELSSIYFGGGTPSLMRPQTVEAVLDAIAAHWPLADDCEITLEANPSSSETEKFKAFRAAGVNRLSLGVQALDDASLRFLGRAHDANAARRAIESAGQIFDRFSFDLIYARQGQTLEAWEQELREALIFAPRHLSLYQLTIEPNTVFYKRAKTEKLQAEPELAAEMFEQTQVLLEEAGLPAYEISNHAVAGQESRHNLTYWEYNDYLGIGPGAHGRAVNADGARLAMENIKNPTLWLAQVAAKDHGQDVCEAIDLLTAQKEALMMGLRLRKGLDLAVWQEKFGSPLDAFLPDEKRKALMQEGLVTQTEQSFCATEAGRQRLDAVLQFFLA